MTAIQMASAGAVIIFLIICLPWLIEKAAYVFGKGVARGKIDATREALKDIPETPDDDEVNHAPRT